MPDLPARAPSSPEAETIRAELARHPALAVPGVDLAVLADVVAGGRMGTGKPLAWVLAAVGEAAGSIGADLAAGRHPTAADVAHRVRAYAARARRPEPLEPDDAPRHAATGTDPDPSSAWADDVPEMPADALPPREAAERLRAILADMGGARA
ncbi:MAG: hypothetical protein ACR2JV_06225 [Gaiellales bacterium]